MSDPAEVTINLGDENMAESNDVDYMSHIKKTGSEAFQAIMTEIGSNAAVAHNLARLGTTVKFNELGTLESRANSGVMATPIASPTTKS